MYLLNMGGGVGWGGDEGNNVTALVFCASLKQRLLKQNEWMFYKIKTFQQFGRYKDPG